MTTVSAQLGGRPPRGAPPVPIGNRDVRHGWNGSSSIFGLPKMGRSDAYRSALRATPPRPAQGTLLRFAIVRRTHTLIGRLNSRWSRHQTAPGGQRSARGDARLSGPRCRASCAGFIREKSVLAFSPPCLKLASIFRNPNKFIARSLPSDVRIYHGRTYRWKFIE
jgi:hypothetical protein